MNKTERPKFFGHEFRLTWNDILTYLACIGLGAVLCIWPAITQEIVISAVGAIIIVCGICMTVRYALMDVYKAIDSNAMVAGLAAIALGILVIVLRKPLSDLIPVLLGFYILLCGLTKLHLTLNLKRMNVTRWTLMLISAAFSVVLGITAICRPGLAMETFMRILGIVLIIEGLLDFVSSFIYIGLHDSYISLYGVHVEPQQETVPPNAPTEEDRSVQ